MRRADLPLLLTAALVSGLAAGGGAVVAPAPAAAQGDVRKEARLLYVDGKFREAEDLLKAAGPDVAGDPELRAQLADAALKHLRNKAGEERRAGLDAARTCWGVVAKALPTDAAALTGALATARELAALDVAAKRADAAQAQLDWALGLVGATPVESLPPDAAISLAEVYAARAATRRKPDLAEKAWSDYDRAAAAFETTAARHANPADCLARAARARLDAARFLHDTIPLDTETRDEQAIAAALGLATRACETKGAADPVFGLHLQTLAIAHAWKVPGISRKVFLQPLVPPYQGLKLEIPRGGLWKTAPKTAEWDVILERKFEDDTSAVQVMITAREPKSLVGGRQWAQIDAAAQVRYESRKGQFTDGTTVDTPPARLGGKKGDVSYFEVGGMLPELKRPQRLVEFVWPSTDPKDDVVWNLRVVDWRRPSSIDDPDVAAVVASAIGAGLWPPGQEPAAEPDPKRKPPKKGK